MKVPVLLGAMVLVVAACGGTDATTTTTEADVPAETTTTGGAVTTAPPAPTTTAAPTTTVPATTAAPPEPDRDAMEEAMERAMAAVDALPDDWDSELIDETDLVEVEEGEDDAIFGPCTPDDAFDVELLDESTAAAYQADFNDPVTSGFFPGANGNIEVRVFESEDVAAEAFEVLETVYGTDEGRDCVADAFLAEMEGEIPVGDEFDFSITELEFDGADIASRIEFILAAEGISAMIFLDFVASRDGATTIFSTYMSFNEPFPEDIAEPAFNAALDA